MREVQVQHVQPARIADREAVHERVVRLGHGVEAVVRRDVRDHEEVADHHGQHEQQRERARPDQQGQRRPHRVGRDRLEEDHAAVAWRELAPEGPEDQQGVQREPEGERHEVQEAARARRELREGAHADVPVVALQGVEGVRVEVGVLRVAVVLHVVPAPPQPRGEPERGEQQAADRVAQPRRLHDGAVQHLVREEAERGERQAHQDAHDELEEERPGGGEDRERAERDDEDVRDQPEQSGGDGVEDAARQVLLEFAGVQAQMLEFVHEGDLLMRCE